MVEPTTGNDAQKKILLRVLPLLTPSLTDFYVSEASHDKMATERNIEKHHL